jgi:PilZ domain-containing protein
MPQLQSIPPGPQRTYPRWRFSFPIQAQGEHYGNALDISEGGIGFLSDTEFKPGTRIKVKFRLPEHAPQEFELPAEVRWCKNYHVGTQFVDLDEDVRMKLFVAIYEAAAGTR